MSLKTTGAAVLMLVGTLMVPTAHAERIGNKAWRWTSWNVRSAVTPAPIAAAPTPAPVAPAPLPPPVAAAPIPIAPAPAPVSAPIYDASVESSRFAVTNPNPVAPVVAPAASEIPPRADAFINFGAGPYPDAAQMTVGDARPWYESPVVSKVFGGAPTDQQRADFTNTVLQDVRGVYARSGLPQVQFTTDPNVAADHTMSVASGLSYPGNPNVIGITNVGRNGVSLIDHITAANTPDQLATAVANNVSHELMHAFGVADHPDHTGEHVDAADATWATLTDPNASLSDEAVQAILSRSPSNGIAVFGAETLEEGGFALEILAPTPVPEPSTIALWTVAGTVALYLRRRGKIQGR